MRQISVKAMHPLQARAVADLRPTLQEKRTLADVLDWLRTLAPPRSVHEITTQDEYTHDVVVRYDEERWLVFDTN